MIVRIYHVINIHHLCISVVVLGDNQSGITLSDSVNNKILKKLNLFLTTLGDTQVMGSCI